VLLSRLSTRSWVPELVPPTTELGSLAFAVRQRTGALEREAGEAVAVARQGKAAEAEVASLRAALELHEKAVRVLSSIGEEHQEAARAQVEGLVTRALQVVFSEELSFHLVPSVSGNRAVVDFVLRSTYPCTWCRGTGRDNDEAGSPCVYCKGASETVIDTPVMEARGGGMAAVVGFVLRLVVLLLTPGARRFLALDESFAHVSASYEPRVAEFLREVADKAGVQLLLITHSTAYGDVADTSYRLVLGEGGVTEVRAGESE
jgi:hypothetical protein